jgi:CheY-like chemotaxis protein
VTAQPPSPAAPPSVLVVDDQELVRMGFRLILERAGLVVVGEGGGGGERERQKEGEDRPGAEPAGHRMSPSGCGVPELIASVH